MRPLLFGALAVFAITSLSNCMRSVSMDTLRPAEITFPTHVNKVLLVNRTKFNMNGGNILEGLLTGELPGEDQAAAEAALSAFQSTILRSPRFEIARYPQLMEGNSITAAFPPAMPWSKVESLARNSNSDAVIAVEIFDTDFIITNGTRKVKKKVEVDGETVEREVTEFYAEGVANVKIGFRVYDIKSKSIADQQLFNQTRTWSSGGETALAAARALIGKSEAARQVSQAAANSYAYKIAPMPVRISRDFYIKANKTNGMGLATRKADVNDWEGAIDVWKRILPNAGSDRDAGRIAYNLAIGHEVMGDLNKAKDWAQDAYVKYGNNKARSYIGIIERRMIDEERVMQQMQ